LDLSKIGEKTMTGILENKVAIITGAATGIGRASALAFAREGAKVVVADIADQEGEKTVQMIRDAGGETIYFHCDVTRAPEVDALVAKTVTAFGRLDCAFNNAGFEGDFAPTLECSEVNFDLTLAINLKGVWLCMKAEMKQMIRQKSGGAIVNTASVAGLVAERGYPAYAAAKGGVIQLTRTAAVEYASTGIRINAICPGVISTPMIDRSLEKMSFAGMVPGVNPKSVSGWVGEKIMSLQPLKKAMLNFMAPVGRPGKPEEIAEAAVFLCSDKTPYMTGQMMVIDGGMTAA
jgi:NAD(P)-dependent dehydrogenase (short-subunit alcohol dehydrogenase family)